MEISDIIYREIISEEVGIWYISDITGSKILIKVPSATIKLIAKKCKLQLLFEFLGRYGGLPPLRG